MTYLSISIVKKKASSVKPQYFGFINYQSIRPLKGKNRDHLVGKTPPNIYKMNWPFHCCIQLLWYHVIYKHTLAASNFTYLEIKSTFIIISVVDFLNKKYPFLLWKNFPALLRENWQIKIVYI